MLTSAALSASHGAQSDRRYDEQGRESEEDSQCCNGELRLRHGE
jgi:hypothetical protein